jgi:hypothetical protein
MRLLQLLLLILCVFTLRWWLLWRAADIILKGNVSYSKHVLLAFLVSDNSQFCADLPSLHPVFGQCSSILGQFIVDSLLTAIPTEPCGGNHTIAYARAAATQEAHDATIVTTKGLAATGFRVIYDAAFFQEVGSLAYFVGHFLLMSFQVKEAFDAQRMTT